ncbi:RHS repeat-associated core domain-containing protein [Pseudomonas asiatica]|uniref:RHS repeat-associated core domain-containing protein n=1 Tax=Pseudomonas asiatica TaxID=2219225 RepID=UPI0032EB7BB1
MRSATPQSKQKKFFFQDNQLTCEASDSPRRLLWANGITLAELDTSKKASQILQSDNANTALRSIPEGLPQNYSPYGFLQTTPLAHLVAFSGQRLDTMLQCYALGNGRRFYSPRSRRFLQSDNQSPFRKGGPNGYSYCQNDPINRHDPNGQWWQWLKRGVNWLAGKLPTYSVDRPQLRTGNQTLQSPNVNIRIHTTEQAPSPDSFHVSLNIRDIEFAARIGNRVINSATVLEPLSNAAVRQLNHAAAGLAVAYTTDRVTNSIFGEPNTALAVTAELGTLAYLDRRLISDTASAIRNVYFR